MKLLELKLSTDRKVTPKAKLNNNRWVPEIKNAFGLPAHISCPGKTTVCESICYAHRLEKAYTNVDKLLKHNYQLLYDRRNSVNQMSELLIAAVSQYDISHDKLELKHNKAFPRVFRIHWDGDFFSVKYAQAWAKTIEEFPHIQFWAYTRSFIPRVNVVPHLSGLKNLSLYLSVDSANENIAKSVIEENPWLKAAYLGEDWDSAKAGVQVVINKQAPKCPENTGRYDLVTENQQGACVECMLCINGVNDVLFAINKN